jgi:hypothetical protein
MVGNQNGIVVTFLVASCCIALTPGNVNTVTADILTGEGMVAMYQSLKAKISVRREREEKRRGELLCVL